MGKSAEGKFSGIICYLLCCLTLTEAFKMCTPDYICHEGHCCGRGRCCANYFEMWWFWIMWIIIVLIGLCWFYHHRRMKTMVLQQRNNVIVETISTIAVDSSHQHQDTKVFQLPSYEEIKVLPTEPPPYAEIASDLDRAHLLSHCNFDCVQSSEVMEPEPPLVGGPPAYTVNQHTRCKSDDVANTSSGNSSHDNRVYTNRPCEVNIYTGQVIQDSLTASLLNNEEDNIDDNSMA